MTETQKQNTKTKTIFKKTKKYFNQKLFNVFLFMVIIASCGYYLTSINDLIVKGFIIQKLKNEVNKISDENKNLELETALLMSYNDLNKKAKNLNMVAANNISYIDVVNGVVAKR